MYYFGSITAMEKDIPEEGNLPVGGTKKTQKVDQTAETERELRVYEISYLLLPLITEEDIPKEAGRVKELISLSGGVIFSEEEPKLIPLAYEMSKVISNKNTKFNNAYFGWVKFEGEAAQISTVKKALENNENILRFLILKTTKEVAVVRKPFSFNAKPIKSAPVAPKVAAKDEVKPGTEAPQEIDEVELDKTIDDLVIE